MKKQWIKMAALLLALVLLQTGCTNPAMEAGNLMKGIQAAGTAVPGPPGEEAREAMAAFASKLFEASAGNSGNVMVSPTSVYFALAMALNGADGETREAMLELLAENGISVQDINEASRDWLAFLEGGDSPLAIANSIWFDKDFVPNKPFLQANADYYNAGARKLDFKSPASPDAINAWVDDATRGTIDKIVGEIGPDVVMYLVNAVYFKADWEDKFDAANTADRAFRAPTGAVEAPFMNRTGTMVHMETEDASGVVLPYEGGGYAFAAILPAEGTGPREWLAGKEGLFAETLAAMMEQSGEKQVQLSLPKFESEYEDSLLDELAALGMGAAFSPGQADFSQMNESHAKDLFISEIKHKTFVRVDEEGTEAGAATSVEVSLTSMPVDLVSMVFDRPFIYCIVDTETSLPVFAGIMENPAM